MFGGCYSPGVCSVWCLLVVMVALPSLYTFSQAVASLQRQIEEHEEVSVECSRGVVSVWPCLTWWYLVFVGRG